MSNTAHRNTGFHEYGIHSSTLGNTTWIARSSRHAFVEFVNSERLYDVGAVTIHRLRSNVSEEPTDRGVRRWDAMSAVERSRAWQELREAFGV